ncbi:MAG: DsbA family protein [Sulfurimonas sp.]
MLRLLATTLLLSSFVYADTASEKVEDFLSDKFEENPKLDSVNVDIDDVVPLKDLKGWSAYIVNIQAKIKNKPKSVIKQKMIWFSNGEVITKELSNMHSGQSYTEMVKPKFKDIYYKKENLIYGNANAKHKVAIFSDPLCPFCKSYVPAAIKEMKKYPQKFAIYYYHFPLDRLHPASVPLVKAAAAAELKGKKDVILKLYTIKVNAHEKDIKKILAAFNKAVGANITVKDLQSPAVLKHVNSDLDIANNVMIAGTPSVFLDGKNDRSKNKYKKVK